MARKFSGIPPATPDDPDGMMRWFQAVQNNSRDNTLVEEGKKRHRGRTENTENYTVSSEDAGKVIILSGSTGRTFTIGADTVVQNDRGRFRQEGTGVITIVGATGTNLRINGDFNAKTRGQFAEVEWEKISPTEIIITGQLDPISSVSLLITETSTASTIVVPSNIVVGDVMVLIQRSRGSVTTPVDVTPTGWTDVGAAVNVSQGVVLTRVSHKFKVAESSDSGATVTGMNGDADNFKILLVFRLTTTATSVSPQSLAGEMVGGDPSAQIVTSGGGTTPLIVVASFGEKGGNQTGISFSPAEDGIVTNTDIDGYFKIYNSSPANVTVDLGDGGDGNSLCSFYLEVS